MGWALSGEGWKALSVGDIWFALRVTNVYNLPTHPPPTHFRTGMTPTTRTMTWTGRRRAAKTWRRTKGEGMEAGGRSWRLTLVTFVAG